MLGAARVAAPHHVDAVRRRRESEGEHDRRHAGRDYRAPAASGGPKKFATGAHGIGDRRETTRIMSKTSLRAVILPHLVLAGVLGAGGCLTPKGDLGEFTGTDAADTTGDDGDGTTTAPETGTSDGTTAADTGDLPVCPDPEQAEWFGFAFDPPLQGDDFVGDCLVDDAGDLQCGEHTVVLDLVLNHQPTPPFKAGDTVALRYVRNESFYTSEWFTIREPGTQSLLLGGVNGDRLSPPDGVSLFDPVILDKVDGVCAPPTWCDKPYELVAVEATVEQEVVEVMPGAFAQVGDTARFDVSVGDARKSTSQFSDGKGGFCEVSDNAPYWFQLLLRPVPQ